MGKSKPKGSVPSASRKAPRSPKVRTRTIRRSNTVSPNGVGAIYDFGDESLVAMDIFHWAHKGDIIRLPRLEKELGVSYFLMAPIVRDRHSALVDTVPYHRFPQWLFCPSCRSMIRWSYTKEQPGKHPQCEKCPRRSKLVPMRFVTACKNGHLSDLPWERWAHSKGTLPSQLQCQAPSLKFEARRGGGGGLGSLWVVCKTCNAARSLHGIVRKDSLRGIIGDCENRQPWERQVDAASRNPCSEFPQVLQRGATNLYFAKVPSAIDIPDALAGGPDPLVENIRSHNVYDHLKKSYESIADPASHPGVDMLAGIIATDLHCDKEAVLRIVHMELNPAAAAPKGEKGMLREEWEAFLDPITADDPKAAFVAEAANISPITSSVAVDHPYSVLASCLHSVVLARRLREVRALQGFERQEPGSTLVRPAIDRTISWLPGIEVFGEGIFLSLAEQKLAAWEAANRDQLKLRLGAMELKRLRTNLSFLPDFSARFVLLHTLAHMLIRQLSFECGYASSSLRERIYAAAPTSELGGMAGILIYTAEGDSEGSLGGLVREGQPERLFPTVLHALQNARWCSADPICRELEAQGLQGLNRAACHACALVSETSCICSNVMLDRAVLVGDEAGLQGFFAETCTAMEAAVSRGPTS